MTKLVLKTQTLWPERLTTHEDDVDTILRGRSAAGLHVNAAVPRASCGPAT